MQRYLRATGSPRFSALSLLPLLALYEAGVRLGATDGPMIRNSVDVWLRHCFPGVTLEIVPLVALVALIYVRLRGARNRRSRFRVRWVGLFGVETILWALTVLALMRLFQFAEPGTLVGRVGNAVAAATGAGVFEELVFRLGLAGGIYRILLRVGSARVLAWSLALWTSALVFAAAHVYGTLVQPIDATGFFRLLLLGLMLGSLYLERGLAAAAYVHTFYDLFVLML